ncbi:MAG: ArsS family sensor histidine kinase [Arcobacteraceae bacterium]
MKRESIFFTLTVSFILGVILVISSFIILITHNYKVNEEKYVDKYMPIVKMISRQERFGFTQEFLENLKESNYELFLQTKHINGITYNPNTKVLFERIHPKHNDIFRVLGLNENNYIYIKRKGTTFLLKDNETSSSSTQLYLMLIFGSLLVMVFLLYFITLKKLLPLKVLKEKVMTLGDENFDFECCNNNKNDEVSLLAKEFKKSALKLKKIKESRNVFIRNIMHELKTPITKGKFLVQLPNTLENSEKMKNVFDRLENLINEFSSIEEVMASSKQLERSYYFLNDIIDNAVDILLLDEEVINKEFENLKLNVNFKLFSIAVKNLIDNAIKYSLDGKATVKTQNGTIVFENLGEPLQYELEAYFEPFFTHNNPKNHKESFGLGLYIVHAILNVNECELKYTHNNGVNQFIIRFKKSKNDL